MRVPVVNVGVVRVGVNHWRMDVMVGVRLAAVPGEIMNMSMMFVVSVGVRVFEWVVRMQVPMMLRDMEPDTNTHQESRRE